MNETIRNIPLPSKRGLILFAAIIVAVAIGFVLARREKMVSGTVVDCESGLPVPGATISLRQSGWGYSEYLVWDKAYPFQTESDASGHFEAIWRVGDVANISAKKDGYLEAMQHEFPGSEVMVRMRKGSSPIDVTYGCRTSSECYQTTVNNGVEELRNICL
jgi:hypothetical protein